MKILLCTNAFAPKVGGQETIVMLLAKYVSSISAGSLDLTLVTPTPADGMNDACLPFHVVRQPNFMMLLRLVRQADIIHLAGPLFVPMIVGLVLRKHVVVEHHGFQAICPNGQLLYEPTQTFCPGHFMAGRARECIRCNAALGKLRSIKMWILTFPRRWLCFRVAVNILPTRWLGSLLQLNRMKTIPHGLPPLEAVPSRRAAPAVPTFTFLGRLVSTKGVRVLLEAAHQLKAKRTSFQIKIIGQGPDGSALQQLARDLQVDDSVRFFGYVPAEQLDGILADTTAVVMPSLAGEVFGLAAAENMQQGRLLIVSDIGALAEVVGDSGLKFTSGDASSLARCMEAVIVDPSLAQELGRKAARRIAECFAVDQMAKEHFRVYEELCTH